MTKLDRLLVEFNVSNHDLVETIPDRLNHKMVQKARLGKRALSKHSQELIIRAVNLFLKPEKLYKKEDLFEIPERQE